MKKSVTEDRTFCDFCDNPAYTQCLLCGKDLCSSHRIEVVVYLEFQSKPFQASLCPSDARWIQPFLEECKGKSTSWAKAGHNPEFNEARLQEAIDFIKKGVHAPA